MKETTGGRAGAGVVGDMAKKGARGVTRGPAACHAGSFARAREAGAARDGELDEIFRRKRRAPARRQTRRDGSNETPRDDIGGAARTRC